MTELKNDVQTFIVQRLACYESVQDIAAAAKEIFDIEISRQLISSYDASKPYCRASKKWKSLFYSERARFLKEIREIPILNKSFRGAALQRAYDKLTANERGANWKLVLAVLEQAAREEGNFYTNRRELTGANGKDLLPADIAREVFKELLREGIDRREAIDFIKERYNVDDAILNAEILGSDEEND